MVVKSFKSELKDELSLQMGSVVEVVERTMDGWWLVRCRGKQGRAPATNMRRANTLKAQHILDISSQATLEAQVMTRIQDAPLFLEHNIRIHFGKNWKLKSCPRTCL